MPIAEHVRPASADACASLLARFASEGRSVRVRGGGTKDHLGAREDTAVVLETGALTGIVDHVPADLTVTVAGGTPLAALATGLAVAGQFLPLDAPFVGRGATVGGVIATNSAGFGRLRYGGVRDLVLGLRVALADGTVVRSGGQVVKNVAGYDLNKLFGGSCGTLGVIVEATLKVLPLPPATEAVTIAFRRSEDAFGAADAIVRTSLRPTALVVEHADDDRWRLTVAAADEAEPVARAMREARQLGAARSASVEPIDDLEAVLGPLRDLVDHATDGAVVRASLPLSAQRAFADAAVALGPFARLVADAGSGSVLIQLQGTDAAVVRAADGLIVNARVLGGTARIERSAVRGLTTYGDQVPNGAFLMRRLKDAFDPAGILEPGRLAIA
ncbi:MAG TPA: FAD-binding protein [Candidatus Saccharimonadales bacterium]|nr:FAD-binding protein [Candidatus Saccharimonadales bacterium]